MWRLKCTLQAMEMEKPKLSLAPFPSAPGQLGMRGSKFRSDGMRSAFPPYGPTSSALGWLAISQRARGERLAGEALDSLGIAHQLRGQDLERHAPPEALVLSELDIGHAAAPEELEDALVAAMAVGREGAH
ncbi:hypothetical protein [Thioflavicoccus mobilis]|uniref:hypothetical protein n=1 Tax=Thioflavicoccus mobilis TaxID=80679 RepID=UPI0005A27EF5|nr:hypothetical protein [Thioflavicoccus mobilis]